jgi:predicted permease
VLIAVEVAIAMVLLVGAGVMIRSFARLISSDLGFDPERLASIDVAPLDRNPDIFKAYYPALLHGIRAMPAVAHASAIDDLPLVGGSSFTIVRSGSARGGLACAQILPDYFETLDIPLRAGRLPADADFRAGRPVAVLSQDAATMLFGDQQALGRELTLGSDHTFQVIGIVGNVYHGGADWQREPKVYVLYGQMPPRALSLVVRLRPGAAVTGDQLRSAANAVGPKVFVNKISTGEAWLGTNTMTVRHRTQLFALLGVLGLVLALVGIFSVTAYAVVNRTREIGVRVALGARTNQVVGGILRDAVWPVALGAAAGVAGATAATRVIATFLFKTTPNDPLTLATAGLLLVAAGCLAAWLPARRAALVDPVTALRAD